MVNSTLLGNFTLYLDLVPHGAPLVEIENFKAQMCLKLDSPSYDYHRTLQRCPYTSLYYYLHLFLTTGPFPLPWETCLRLRTLELAFLAFMSPNYALSIIFSNFKHLQALPWSKYTFWCFRALTRHFWLFSTFFGVKPWKMTILGIFKLLQLKVCKNDHFRHFRASPARSVQKWPFSPLLTISRFKYDKNSYFCHSYHPLASQAQLWQKCKFSSKSPFLSSKLATMHLFPCQLLLE